MKISLTSVYWNKPEVREILDQCDLIFITAGIGPEQREDLHKTFGNKLVQLQYCGSSRKITDYLTYGLSLFDIISKNEELELQTIKASLPKGIELELYNKDIFRNKGDYKPITITL